MRHIRSNWSSALRPRALVLALGFTPLVAMWHSAQAQTPAPPPHFAVRDARIVTGTGETIARGTIVFKDGLITAVGSNVSVPADAWVIDGSGLTVYPGLIDALSTMGLPAEFRAPQGGGGSQFGGGPAGGGASNVPYSRGPEDRP